jgi:hypothetical protein
VPLAADHQLNWFRQPSSNAPHREFNALANSPDFVMQSIAVLSILVFIEPKRSESAVVPTPGIRHCSSGLRIVNRAVAGRANFRSNVMTAAYAGSGEAQNKA